MLHSALKRMQVLRIRTAMRQWTRQLKLPRCASLSPIAGMAGQTLLERSYCHVLFARRVAGPVQRQLLVAILMRIGAGILTVIMAAVVRLLSPHMPVGEIVFGRSAGALLLIVTTLAINGQVRTAFTTSRPLAQIVRGLTGSAAMVLNFLALAYLSLGETQSIMYTSPLFTVVIAAAVLRHRVSSFRWAAVVMGFCGTALVLGANPVSAWHASLLGSSVAVAGAALTAAALLQVHNLARTETTPSIATYFTLIAALGSLATLPFGWIWPTIEQLAQLALLGALGALAHLLLTLSLANAEPTLLAPFEFLNIIWAIAVGTVFFDEQITALSLAGAVLIIAASFAITITTAQSEPTIKTAALARPKGSSP